jgi:arsenate reductase (thioredoxin)
MAEGWARHLKAQQVEAISAGTHPHGVDPYAVRAMAEAGVDISRQRSRHIHDVLRESGAFDYVVTVCDDAAEMCPVVPGRARHLHVPFPDPPRLAKAAADSQQAFEQYRMVRDQIRDFIQTIPESLEQLYEQQKVKGAVA